ncbi:MAG: acetate kinase [Proteobacteria bacterium]|nr:acetate kinase [Pseudomonadota bacterium]
MNVLVLNCGSSTIKFQIIETDAERIEKDEDRLLARGLLERLGGQGLVRLSVEGGEPVVTTAPLPDHRAAVQYILRWAISPEAKIPDIKGLADIHAVGHRVVHGGERFRASTIIDSDVLKGIEDCVELAPLHNPTNLKGIRAVREMLGEAVPQVAVFDTAFHATMPEEAYLYALPYSYYRRYHVRRYGFHGTSHRYITYRYRRMLGIARDQVNIISLHLGNGCSACAIKGGRSLDTSMGFTPVEGLVMGTRSGDVDPSILEYIAVKEGLSLAELDTLLNKRSGLLGVSGLTHDMRELLEEEAESRDRRARLAIDLFCLRVRKYIGAYLAEMNGADAVVFTGGIGENAPIVRERICAGLDWLGLTIDPLANGKMVGGARGEISPVGARLRAYVIPTNEELLIARDTVRCVQSQDESS